MIWLLIYLLTANKETKDQNYFVLAARSIALVVALHCMVSFPLRVPAIRIFVILIMAVAARHAGNNKPRHVFSRHLLAALPLFLLALAYTISQASVPIEQQYPESHYASKYGRSFELPLLEANQLIDSIWTVDVD